MTPNITFAFVLALFASFVQTPASAPPTAQAAQTPAQCLADVRAYVTKRQQELRPMTADTSAKLASERTAMIKDCVAKFDPATLPAKDLGSMADLYSELNQLDQANAAIAKALASSGLTEVDRANLLGQQIRLMLREPKSDERNARIEKVVDQLDAIGSPAVLETRIGAHVSMNGYYRGDDIDAGIIKHSTWLINTGKTLSPELRKKYGGSIVSAYVNMAEAYAGQARNDEAIALLKRAPAEWADFPDVASRVAPTLERYQLVGTMAAPVTAPRWLNLAAGTTSLGMKGQVTLLEFSAHWCGPCKESYPGINRLRAKYGPRGFRVVLATQLYGYIGTERNLTPDAEFERDRAYFAEHGLGDVPVAVGDRVMASVKEGKVVYTPGPNPNDEAYKVGGIPQIQIIDKQGRIRLIMVGYDDANETALATFIEKLLAEK